MIVRRSSFEGVLWRLSQIKTLALDTETTGLRPFHGDRLFSLILCGAPDEAFYFNFYAYAGLDPDQILLPEHLEKLHAALFSDGDRTWYLHNAKFDLHMLAQNGCHLVGRIHCTKVAARLEYNEHMKYSLDACAGRIGYKKDDTVEKYIDEHKLWEWQTVPGKKQRKKNKFFDRVPFDIISAYGERDAEITYRLGRHQETTVQELDAGAPKSLPTLRSLLENEQRLTAVVCRMERVGLQIDREYCLRAASFEAGRAKGAGILYASATGRDFSDSAKRFELDFASEKSKWTYTEKGNASFDSDTLEKFENPLAKPVLEYRDAKSKADFYQGFLYHADVHGVVHPSLDQDGTATGRFSGREPNFQNLTSEKNVGQEWMVRRAIVPRPGFVLFSLDYDQVEYRLMLDYAADWIEQETELVRLVKSGLDVHTATAQVATLGGTAITRDQAKMTNFLTIYGGGDAKLAEGLKCSVSEARRIRQAIFRAAPEIRELVDAIQERAISKGYLTNWKGRRCQFPDPRWAYKAPNYLIQGGAADVVKVAMVEIDAMFTAMGAKSRMILQVHDELVLEVHETEVGWVPLAVKHIMENVYPHKYLPLTCGVEYSDTSLADLQKWEPPTNGNEAGNSVSHGAGHALSQTAQ